MLYSGRFAFRALVISLTVASSQPLSAQAQDSGVDTGIDTRGAPQTATTFPSKPDTCHPTRLMIKVKGASVAGRDVDASFESAARSSSKAPMAGDTMLRLNGGSAQSIFWPPSAAASAAPAEARVAGDSGEDLAGVCEERLRACEQVRSKLGDVECRPVRAFTMRRITNDALRLNLWGHVQANDQDMDIQEAWDYAVGTGAIIAVPDTGVMTNHPDLVNNIYRNASDPLDGIDNDNNGYIDDANGFDFFNGDNNPNPGVTNPSNVLGHGTHVAGIAAATGNNYLGVVGAGWGAKILPLKVADNVVIQGSIQTIFSMDAIIASVNYASSLARKTGKRVVFNMSFGGGGYDPDFDNALTAAEASGVILVAAAGNSNSSNDVSYDSSNHPKVISVAAVHASGFKADYSNYGVYSVDIAAPGTDILSTTVDGKYDFESGTSMAAPQVAGVSSLLLERCSDSLNFISPRYLNDVLMLSAAPAAGARFTQSGLVNAFEALKECGALTTYFDTANKGRQYVTVRNGNTTQGRFIAWIDGLDGKRTLLANQYLDGGSTKSIQFTGAPLTAALTGGYLRVLTTRGLSAKLQVTAPTTPIVGQTWRAYDVPMRARSTTDMSLSFTIPTVAAANYRPSIELINHGLSTQSLGIEVSKDGVQLGRFDVALRGRESGFLPLSTLNRGSGAYWVKVLTRDGKHRDAPVTVNVINGAMQ